MTGDKKRSFGVSIMGRLLLPIVACILVSFIATTVFWVSKQSNTLMKAFESELALSQTFVAPPVAAAGPPKGYPDGYTDGSMLWVRHDLVMSRPEVCGDPPPECAPAVLCERHADEVHRAAVAQRRDPRPPERGRQLRAAVEPRVVVV